MASALTGAAQTVQTENVTPVANTTAGIWTFDKPQSPCLLSNDSTKRVHVKLNAGTSDGASVVAGDYDFVLADGETRDLSQGGAVQIKNVSVWFPTGGTVTLYSIRGWDHLGAK